MTVMENIEAIMSLIGKMLAAPMNLVIIPEMGITFGQLVIAGILLIVGTMAGVAIARNFIGGRNSE